MRATMTECCESTFPRRRATGMVYGHHPELEEIFKPNELDTDDPDESETARALSEREKRELF